MAISGKWLYNELAVQEGSTVLHYVYSMQVIMKWISSFADKAS